MSRLRLIPLAAAFLMLPVASAAPLEAGTCVPPSVSITGDEACAFLRVNGDVRDILTGDPGAGDIECVHYVIPDPPFGNQVYDLCCYYPMGSNVATFCWEIWYF